MFNHNIIVKYLCAGLKEDQLPKHIYKMRKMGYPPGWLMEAEAANSGLAMFDRHGREVDLDGDLMEDGQVPDHRIRDEANCKSEVVIFHTTRNIS